MTHQPKKAVFGVAERRRQFNSLGKTLALVALMSAGPGIAAASEDPADPLAPQQDSAKLAKQLSNPVASLISVPFQGNWDTDAGADGKGDRYVLQIQPVIPFKLSSSMNLISRTILPVITQTGITGPHRTQTGIGDTVQSLFLSPAKPLGGWLIVGVGPAASLPTGSSTALTSGKLSVGPTFVALTQQQSWIMGVLVNQLWSVAGKTDRPDTSNLFVQPFITYTTRKAMTFGLNSETSCNWRIEGRQCAVPINATVGQLVRFGTQPVSFTFGGRYYANRLPGSPKWGLRFVTTLLFPAHKRG